MMIDHIPSSLSIKEDKPGSSCLFRPFNPDNQIRHGSCWSRLFWSFRLDHINSSRCFRDLGLGLSKEFGFWVGLVVGIWCDDLIGKGRWEEGGRWLWWMRVRREWIRYARADEWDMPLIWYRCDWPLLILRDYVSTFDIGVHFPVVEIVLTWFWWY